MGLAFGMCLGILSFFIAGLIWDFGLNSNGTDGEFLGLMFGVLFVMIIIFLPLMMVL